MHHYLVVIITLSSILVGLRLRGLVLAAQKKEITLIQNTLMECNCHLMSMVIAHPYSTQLQLKGTHLSN